MLHYKDSEAVNSLRTTEIGIAATGHYQSQIVIFDPDECSITHRVTVTKIVRLEREICHSL